MTNNSVKYEVFVKQCLCAILDISAQDELTCIYALTS